MPDNQPLAFGPYRLDPRRGLWRGRREVKLAPKALVLLRFLLERAGDVLTKEEVFRAVWPDTAVSDGALTSCIRELRRALRDDARQPQYVETLHRRGYRFVAKVRSSPAPSPGPSPSVIDSPTDDDSRRPRAGAFAAAPVARLGRRRRASDRLRDRGAGYRQDHPRRGVPQAGRRDGAPRHRPGPVRRPLRRGRSLSADSRRAEPALPGSQPGRGGAGARTARADVARPDAVDGRRRRPACAAAQGAGGHARADAARADRGHGGALARDASRLVARRPALERCLDPGLAGLPRPTPGAGTADGAQHLPARRRSRERASARHGEGGAAAPPLVPRARRAASRRGRRGAIPARQVPRDSGGGRDREEPGRADPRTERRQSALHGEHRGRPGGPRGARDLEPPRARRRALDDRAPVRSPWPGRAARVGGGERGGNGVRGTRGGRRPRAGHHGGRVVLLGVGPAGAVRRGRRG